MLKKGEKETVNVQIVTLLVVDFDQFMALDLMKGYIFGCFQVRSQ